MMSRLVRMVLQLRPGCCSYVTPMELSGKYRIGTPADTPASLRRKAAEFLRMAESVRDIEHHEELRLLATLYAERASELERSSKVAVLVPPPEQRDGR